MQRRLNSEMGVNKPFENGSCQGRIQKFFVGEGINFCHFFPAYFFRQMQKMQKFILPEKR